MFIILNFYAPGWFYIKTNFKLQDAARNFFQLIKLSRRLRTGEYKIIRRVLKTNCFSSRHESVLISMLIDPFKHVRTEALRMIMNIQAQKSTTLRQFKKPASLNFDARWYYEVIDLSKYVLTESHVTFNFTTRHLKSLIKSTDGIQIEELPNNIQGVERMIKVVTGAPTKHYGEINRHHFILNFSTAKKATALSILRWSTTHFTNFSFVTFTVNAYLQFV